MLLLLILHYIQYIYNTLEAILHLFSLLILLLIILIYLYSTKLLNSGLKRVMECIYVVVVLFYLSNISEYFCHHCWALSKNWWHVTVNIVENISFNASLLSPLFYFVVVAGDIIQLWNSSTGGWMLTGEWRVFTSEPVTNDIFHMYSNPQFFLTHVCIPHIL